MADRIFLFCTVALVALGGSPLVEAAREAAPLTAAGEARCAIVCELTDSLCRHTAKDLADYLCEHTGIRPTVFGAGALKRGSRQTLIVIDGSKDGSLLSQVGVKVEIPTDRNDAYGLAVVHRPPRWIIAAAGRSAAGAKYAVYRLMEEMEIYGQEAAMRPMSLQASPFFATRSVSLFNIWRVPVDVIRQCNLESWPSEKAQRSIDTYDAFGFNAVETHDRFGGDWLKAVYGLSREQWRDKVYAICDRAHENGMTVFLRMWGNSLSKPLEKIEGGYTPFGFVNLAPDIPEERKRWETELRDYASKTYAGHIDHLIGHWADAGGVHPGSKATVRDSMLLHNDLVKAFRAINPRVQSSFNLWGMANPRGHRGWPGYVDHRSICDAGILPEDVAIAQTTRSRSHIYSEKETSDILASGHPAAVWTWRRADTEVRMGDPGLRIRIHDLRDYFRSLPDSARQLSWHNVERNHHGLANDVNYYVAGKLMWDPKTDVDVALLKYCELVFGVDNAKAVAEAFNTIEASRDVENETRDDLIAHATVGGRRARAALDGLASVVLPSGFRSRLPSVITPQEMLDQLRATLRVIAENGEIVAEQLPALDAMIRKGNTEEAKSRLAALQSKAEAWFGTVAGGVEGLWLKEALNKRMVSSSSRDKLGFRTYNLVSMKVAEEGDGFTLAAQGKEPGLALRELETPSGGPVEFHVRLKSMQTDRSRNGGLVFGASDMPRDLIRCQAYLGGKYLQIAGSGVVPVRVDGPELDASAEQQCVVTVDPAKQAVSFRVGGVVAETKFRGKPDPIKWFGYVVEKTTTRFGPIEVKQL